MNKSIYELEGVYGDEEKFTINNSRLKNIFNVIGKLNYKPTNILDIGCGTGYLADILAEMYPSSSVYAVDISEMALSIGKEKYSNVKFIHADAEVELPFKSNYFDLVISGEHIEHIKDVDNYLIEINRVMKKNGALVLSTPNLGFWFSRLLLLFGKQPFYLEPSLRITLPILKFYGKTFPNDLKALPSGHLRLYTLNMLVKLLKVYGFSVNQVKGNSFFKSALLGPIDNLFAFIPSLSFGLVLLTVKKN